MKNTILKIALFSVFIAILISLAGCASEDTVINAASDVSDSSVLSPGGPAGCPGMVRQQPKPHVLLHRSVP